MPIEEDDGEMDIYAALGLNTPVGPQEGVASSGLATEPYDPLAALWTMTTGMTPIQLIRLLLSGGFIGNR